MGAAEVTAFLPHLAVECDVAASTRNQALGALLFLYGEVLKLDLPWLGEIQRATRPAKLPVVLTREETRAVLAGLAGEFRLMADLLYGSGLRLLECLRLRVKDVDFAYLQITVREGKGARDRITVLPASLVPTLRTHLEAVRSRHEADLAAGHGRVMLPHAGSKISQRRRRVGLAMDFPAGAAILRSDLRYPAAPSCSREEPANRREEGGGLVQVAAREGAKICGLTFVLSARGYGVYSRGAA